jgi:hypothetical protein
MKKQVLIFIVILVVGVAIVRFAANNNSSLEQPALAVAGGARTSLSEGPDGKMYCVTENRSWFLGRWRITSMETAIPNYEETTETTQPRVLYYTCPSSNGFYTAPSLE